MESCIYTFWAGVMPDYLKMCLRTWKFPYILLNYDNIEQYIGKLPDKLLQLTLPKIADYIRVHLLTKYGGYWLDVDTVMLTNSLPNVNVMGYPDSRAHTIGFLYTAPQSDMYQKWSAYQDKIVQDLPIMNTGDTTSWNIMGNAFTDKYVAEHKNITIGDIKTYWPETYMIPGDAPRREKYIKFHFESAYSLESLDCQLPNMIMLHNSWTPHWYKSLDSDAILRSNVTLSNIFKSIL